MPEAQTQTETQVDELKKESFDIGISDETLLIQIKAWERESEEFYTVLKRVWATNIDYYKGIQTDVEKIYGRLSKAVENRIWMATETMIPIATAKLPDIVIRPDKDNEQSVLDASELQDILNFQMEDKKILKLAEVFLRHLIIYRYGVLKPFWDKENDDVGVRAVHPKRIRIPKFGVSVSELAFVIEDLELSYDSIVSFFGEEKAKKVLANAGKDSEDKIRKKTFSIQEVWTNEFVCWRYGELILDKNKNLFWKKDNFFDSPRKPYIIYSLFETEESLIGDTDYIQQLKPIQDNINIRKRQVEDITNKVSNPFLLVDSEVMSEEEAANITNEPGFIIYGKDAASGTKIRFESPGQVPAQLFNDLQYSRSEFDNIWGVHSTTRGEREGRETLGGRQILKEADLGRIEPLARRLEWALDELAEYWTQLIKLFYTEEKTFTILGEDGLRFVKNFTGSRVGKVKLRVTTGSTLKEDEFQIAQKAIVLWQNKAIGLKTLYKMIKLPNMQEAIADFVETQSGQILQQGQAAAGIPAVASPAGAPQGV